MKKFLLSLCALVLLVVLGALFLLPYGLGLVAQQRYLHLLSNFQSPVIDVKVVDYQRHWFSSNATLQIALKSQNATPQTYLVQQHIQHGPLLTLTSNGQTQVMSGQALMTSHADLPLGAIDATTWIQPTGSLYGTVAAPTLKDGEQNNGITIQGFAGAWQLSADGQHFSANFSIPTTRLQIGANEQHIDNIAAHYDLRKSASHLFLGKKQISIDSVTWNMAQLPAPLQMTGITLQSINQEQNRHINSDVTFGIKTINLNHIDYGPQQVQLAINGLDVPALIALRNSRYHTTGNPAINIAALFNLLSKGVQVELKHLQFMTAWGTPAANGKLTLPQHTAPVRNYRDLADSATADIQATMPATFLMRSVAEYLTPNQASAETEKMTAPATDKVTQQAQQMIADWVNKKWLLIQGNNYLIHLVYRNQQLFINDQPYITSPAPASNAPPTPLPLHNTLSIS